MSETKLLINSIKDGLYEQLLNGIDERFDEKSLEPPADLIPYLSREKPFVTESEEVRRRIRGIYDEWMEKVARALKRDEGKNSLQEFIGALPEPYKTEFEDAFYKLLLKERKINQ